MAEFEEGINLPQSNNLVPPPGVPSDAFEFESIKDLEIPPNLEVFDDALDSDLEMLMANQANIINSLPGFETAGNVNSPYPSGNNGVVLPGGSIKKRNDLTSTEGVLNFMKGVEATPAELPDQPKIADPIRIGSRSSNFDRYYNHGDFGELGFNPSVDNESYYNANTNWFQEMGRMFPQFARTMGTGFMSSYRAMGDLFSGGPSDYFSEKDLTSAIEYADANRIGSSTSGGAWATNFTLNMGYSMGIIANIAVEEAALFAAAAVQGGLNPASDAALVVRTGSNAKRFFSAIGNAFNVVKMAKASRNLLMKLNKFENFKSFGQAVKTGGNFLGDILAPETVRAFKSIQTVAKTGENMTDIAKAGKILAGTYRDFRSLNMSMSESKMEGGMVFNNVFANGYTAKVLENQAAGLGSELTEMQYQEIAENANKASFATIMRNAPLIYLTNQITLGTAFGGFKRSLPQAMRQGFEGLARRQIRTKAIRTAEGKIAKDVFEDTGESLMEDMFGIFSKQGFKKLKALGVKGSLQATAGGSLRYFAANLSEGAQEIYQEAVANGVENYYNALMFDPSRDEAELYRASVNSALSSQWSSEGIQTFLSGFMMGGAMQGPQNLIFKGAPNLFSYVKDKQGYMDAAKKRDAEAARITKQYNDAWNQQAEDVGYIFDTNIDSFVKQHQSAKESTMAQYDGDYMDNVDAKHFSKFDFLVNLAENGNVSLFREQLNDMAGMTDAELGAAFPSATKSEIKSGKIRTRIQDMLQKSQEIEELVSESKDDSPNPYNPNKFQPGTREYGEEMRSYIAWKHVRYLKMFTKDALVNAGERRLKIAETLASHPVLGKIASNQLTTLLTKTGIEAEISRLAGELEVIEDNKDNKETRDIMQDRLALLGAVAEVLHSPENATALKGRRKGAFDMRSFKKKLRGPLYEYLKHLAGSQDDVVVTSEIDNVLEQIIDYQHLDSRQDKYFMALEMLENPEELERLRTRSKEYLEEYYKHRLARFRDIVDKTAFKKDIKDFLEKLAEKGVFISQDEFNEFIKTGDIDNIKSFFSENGQLNPIEDTELLKQVVSIREQFREILLSQHKARKQKIDEVQNEVITRSDTEKEAEDLEWEEENDVEIDEDITLYGEKDENPVLKALLTRKYNAQLAQIAAINKANGTDLSIPSQSEWLATILPKLNWVESYRKLKSLWGKTLNIPNKNQRDAIYAQDKGFLKWLALSAEQDPQVASIIDKMPNITITDFVESYEAPSMRKDAKGKRITKIEIEGKFYGVKKVSKRNTTTGEKLVAFSVVDLKTGNRPGTEVLKSAGLTHSAFASIALAKAAMKKLDAAVADTVSFTFDKVDLNYGMILTNKVTKEKYIVLSKGRNVDDKNVDAYVYVAPLDEYNELIKAKAAPRELAAIREKIGHGELTTSWDIPLLKFEKSSQNVTKINLDEAVKIQPYIDDADSPQQTALRFSIINQILTEEEIKEGLRIVVKSNGVEPNTPRKKQRFGDKDKNSQLTFLQEALEIRLEFDDATFNKIQLGFETLNIGIEPNKTFGFLKNDTVLIKDLDGNAIDPLTITDEIAENTFDGWSNSASTDIIKANFAKQKVYLRAIYDKLGKADSVELKLSEIEGFDMNTTAGSMAFTERGVETLLSNLNFNSVDGNKVLIVNTKSTSSKGKTTLSTKVITDFEGTPEEEIAFEEGIISDINSQSPAMLDSIKKAGRYVMIVKTANGKYSYAPIKTTRINKEELNDVFGEMLKVAIEIQNTNFAASKEGVAKKRIQDKSQKLFLSDNFESITLAEWNANINKKFFISGIPGYNFELNVTTNGHINLSIYDTKKGERIDTYLDNNESIKQFAGADNQLDLLEELIKNAKRNAASIEMGEKTDVKLSMDNFRESFERTDVSLNEIYEKSSTTLSPLAPRIDVKIRVDVDSVDVQSEIDLASQVKSLDKKDNSTKPKSNGNDIEFYTEEEFDAIFEDNLKTLTDGELEFIAKKIYDNKKGLIKTLSPRYKKIADAYKTNSEIREELDPLIMKLVQQEKSPQTKTLNTKKAINERLAEINNEITGIEDEFDISVEEDEINNDPRIKKLRAEESELIKKRKEANKIISPDLNVDDVEDIDVFMEWAKQNLPDWMNILDIDELGNNLKKGGLRVGAFVMGMRDISGGLELDGTIYTGAKSPFRYHEAWHGVFRMLLTTEQQNELYGIAEKEVLAKMRSKKGYEISQGVYAKSMSEAVELLKNSADTYDNMSIEELRKEVLEEYMADEFEKFKKNPKSSNANSAIKSFFTRLLEWLKSIFSSYNSTSLRPFFEKVDSGNFRLAGIAENGFTESARSGVVIEANAIIPYDSYTDEFGDEVELVLTQDLATSVVTAISARVVSRQMHFKPTKKYPAFDLLKEVEESFALHKKLYDVKNPIYKTTVVLNTPDKKKKLRTLHKAFTDNERAIREGVVNYMELFGVKLSIEENEVDEFEMEFGLRNANEYGKDASMIGGFNSLSKEMRQYFATTTLSEKDFLGNDILDPETNEPLIVAVDFATVYNGFMKVGSGAKTSLEILQRLYTFSRHNPQTRAVADRIFTDLNITGEEVMTGDLQNLDSILAPVIVSAFQNFKVDSWFIHRVNNSNQDNHQKVYTYSAANRDDVNRQIESWEIEWRKRWRSLEDGRDIEMLNKGLKSLDTLKRYVSKQRKSLTEKNLDAVSKKISADLNEAFGISIAPLFIKYSMVKELTAPTKSQQLLIDMYTDNEQISLEAIDELIDALSRKDAETGKADPANILNKNLDENVYNRLRQISRQNAPFDENIGVSMFNNPNGDLVYAHQLPSFNLKQIEALNRHDELMTKIKTDYPNDPVLNSPAFEAMSRKKMFNVRRISGIKESAYLEKTEDNDLIVGTVNDEGKTYGDLNPKEFAASQINAYLGTYNDRSGEVETVVDENGVEHGISPHLMRVAEASNTGDSVPMAVIESVEKDSSGRTVLTEQAINNIVSNIDEEFGRIVDEFGRNPTQDKVEGYNVKNGLPDENGRGFKFHNTETALTPLNFSAADTGRAEEVNILKDELGIMQDEDSNVNVLVQKSQMPGHLIEGTIKNVLVTPYDRPKEKNKKFKYYNDEKVLIKMRYVGPRNLSNYSQQEIFDELGDLISATEKDTHKVKVKINNKVMHTTTNKMKAFIENNQTVYLYEKVDENAEANVLELEGYADRLLTQIKKAKQENNLENFTLEEALKEMGSSMKELRSFVSNRMDQEFAAYQIMLKNIGVKKGDISIDIQKGIDSASGANASNVGKTNRLMNMTSDYDYNLKQIFINDFINTTALNKLLMGDEALSLKNAIDQVKRNKGAIAAYYSAKSDLPINKSSRDLGITEIINEVNLLELTEPIVESTYNADNETEIADAQAYMTIKGFRYTYFGFGKLHPALASLLDKVEAGEEVTSDEYFAAGGKEGLAGHAKMQHMLNSKKYVYYDGQRYLKMSVIFLSKEFTSVKKDGKWVAKRNMRAMHNLRVNLEKSETKGKISLSASASAIKMMKTNLIPHENILGGELTSDELNGTSLDPEYLGLQVINPSNKLIITDPNQIKTIITSQQNDDTDVVMLGINDNKPIKLKDIKELYNASITNRNLLGYTSKRNLVFNLDSGLKLLERSIDADKIDPDLNAFLQYAKDGLMASGSQTDIIPYFTTDPETGEQQYDLNNPKAIDAAKRLFMTFFNTSVISEKVPGISAALVSDQGIRIFRKVYEVDADGRPLRSEVIRESDFRENYNDSDISFDIDDGDNFQNDIIDGLASTVKNSKGKGVIIVDRLRDNVMRYTEDGVATGERYTESMLPAHTANEHDLLYNTTAKIPEAVAKKFGIRIPSQDHHSALNIMIVDFLPTFYGSSIVSARELIEKSGADFDIDKLYIQIKEYYVSESGMFIEYGNIFEHYTIYQNLDVNKRGSTLSEAAKKYNTLGNKKLSDSKIKEIEASGLDLKTWKALTVLNLPRTKSEYKEYLDNNAILGKYSAIPYSAALNNFILDLKSALLGNKNISEYRPLYKDNLTGDNILSKEDANGKKNQFATNTDGDRLYLPPVHAEPADLKPLTDLWKEIEAEFPILAEEAKEDGLNVNNLRAKSMGFANNKAGAKSIGAVVLPNLYLSLLTDFNINLATLIVAGEETQIELEFNKISYYKFGGAFETLENGKAGQRKQYIISSLITAMTDNAKERLAARMKLSISTLGTITNMIALGVPLKTAVLIVNTPIIKENYKEITVNDLPTKFSTHIQRMNDNDPGSMKILYGMLEILDKNLSEEEVDERIDSTNVNQDLLGESINDPLSGFMTIDEGAKFAKSILDENDQGRTDFMIDKIIDELAIIKMYVRATNISDGTRNLKNLMNLASGYDKEGKSEIQDVMNAIDEFHLNDTDAAFRKLDAMEVPIVDVRRIFGIHYAKTWQANSVRQFLDFMTYIPNVFMEYTPNYKRFYNGIIENSNSYKLMGNAGKKLKQTMNRDVLSFLTLKAYMHKMQNSKQGSLKIKSLNQNLLYGENDIVSMLDEAVDLLGDEASSNTWLEDFAAWSEKTDADNKTGIALVQHDTFKKLSYTEKINSQIGLLNIMGTKSTADIGRNTIFYTMIKEGLQHRYRSIGRSIGPQLLGDYLDIIPSVHQALMGTNKNAAIKVFGASIEDLLNEYTSNYMVASSSSIFIPSFGFMGGGAGRSLPNDLIFDPFETASISKRHITSEMAEDDLNNLYFIFDNENQTGEAGSLGSRDEKNVITFVTKKMLGTDESAYFTTTEEQNAAVEEIKKKINILYKLKEGRNLIFQPLMGKAEADRLKKNSPILFKELNNYLKQIGYKFYNKTVKNKKTGKTTVVVDKNPLSSALYLDKSNPTMPIMRIDIFKAFGLSDRFKQTDSAIINRKTRIANSKTNKQTLRNTTEWLRSYGFQINYGEKVSETTVSLPASFKIKIEGKFKTYKLVQVAGEKMNENRSLHVGVINKGTYAAYVEVVPVGSKSVWGGSFMFPGSIDNIEEINARIEENNEEGGIEGIAPEYSFDDESLDDDNPQNFDEDGGFSPGDNSNNQEPVDDSDIELDTLSDKKGLSKRVLSFLEEAADVADNPTKTNQAQSDRLNKVIENELNKANANVTFIGTQIKDGRDRRKASAPPYSSQEIANLKDDLARYQDLISKLQDNKAEGLYAYVMLTVDALKDVVGVDKAAEIALEVIKNCI